MAEKSEIVVLLHGIARTGRAMRPMARALERNGYATLTISYPWRRHDIAELAGFVEERLAAEGVAERFQSVHFVTHSMGGLVAGRYLARGSARTNRIGRVVMLGPPNGGSEVADLLHRLPPFRWFYGQAGQELTTSAQAGRRAPRGEIGIIAGNRGWAYPLGLLTIPGAHDGRVAVTRTRLEGMADHIVLPAAHSFLLTNRAVQCQTLHFLRNGRFDR